jgi:hypothetical protein
VPHRPEVSYPGARVVLRVEGRGGRVSYADMARSHVQQLAREAFSLQDVVVDEDGDLPFPCGTAMLYVSVAREGRLVRVWSRAVHGLEVKKAVLREVNDTNAGLTLARVWASGTAVWVEGWLPVETLRPEDLGRLCWEVGSTADRLGSMLAAVHGGVVAFPDGCDAAHRCDDD